MRLLTAGSLVRVQLGEPEWTNANSKPIFVGEAFAFVFYAGFLLVYADATFTKEVTDEIPKSSRGYSY